MSSNEKVRRLINYYFFRKPLAVKLSVHPDALTDNPSNDTVNNVPHSETPSINVLNDTKNKDNPNDNIIMSSDGSGNMVLTDGTVVVQPTAVADTVDYSLQFDMQDGALPQRSLPKSFQTGSIDTVRCTSCASRINPFECAVHPYLSVILCKVGHFNSRFYKSQHRDALNFMEQVNFPRMLMEKMRIVDGVVMEVI